MWDPLEENLHIRSLATGEIVIHEWDEADFH
jgi:hypothetical protein